jgi:hypothetical protein
MRKLRTIPWRNRGNGAIETVACASDRELVALDVHCEYAALFVNAPELLEALRLCRARMGEDFPPEAAEVLERLDGV